MKRVTAILVATIVPLILAATAISFAQNSPQTTDTPLLAVQGRVVRAEGAPPPPGDTFIFVASEMGFGGKIVQRAPYSAEAVTESIQTLADGNRIVNKTTSVLYRDSEGRTRREQTLKPIGSFVNEGQPIQTIFINDPVAGVSYSLNSRTKVAHKNVPLKLEQRLITRGPIQVPAGEMSKEQRFEYKIENKKPSVGSGPAHAPIPPPIPPHPLLAQEFTLRAESGSVGYVLKIDDDDKRVVKESLGRQTLEGVEAEGTRSTLTIPAGEIGNERDIQVVSERWYSPELQLVVMSKHSDPRTGETIYRLTNINRAEPANDLFELPGGYTVTEGYKKTSDQAMPAKIKRPE